MHGGLAGVEFLSGLFTSLEVVELNQYSLNKQMTESESSHISSVEICFKVADTVLWIGLASCYLFVFPRSQ